MDRFFRILHILRFKDSLYLMILVESITDGARSKDSTRRYCINAVGGATYFDIRQIRMLVGNRSKYRENDFRI